MCLHKQLFDESEHNLKYIISFTQKSKMVNRADAILLLKLNDSVKHVIANFRPVTDDEYVLLAVGSEALQDAQY